MSKSPHIWEIRPQKTLPTLCCIPHDEEPSKSHRCQHFWKISTLESVFSLFYEINAQDLHFIAQILKNLLVCFFGLDAKTVTVLFLSSVVVSETKKYRNNLDVKDKREIPVVKL